jgi:anti-sigma-K factor RskA
MSHEKLQELCPVYAAGALDGEELRELQKHLKTGCPICQRQIREYGELMVVLSQTLPGPEPSAGLKSRVMAQMEKESPGSSVVEFKTSTQISGKEKPAKAFAWLPWACALAAGVALTVSLWNLSNLKRGLVGQQSQLAQQRDQIRQLQNQLEKEEVVTAFLMSPEVRVAMLAGTPKSPRSAGKILWNPGEKKALFYASNLPAPPSGKTYQLWVIAQNKLFDAGTFAVDSSGNGFLKIDSLSEADKAQKFAVTLEPAGGVPQPTGAMHLLGPI